MIIPIIGSDVKWTEIIYQILHVVEFDRAGTLVDVDNKVKAESMFKPYGYLLVESPALSQPSALPIIHRDDFLLATTVFDEPSLMEIITSEELLVTYAPKRALPNGYSFGISHVLHYVIVPNGTMQFFYEFNEIENTSIPALEKLFGRFIYEGEIKVNVNPDPEI